MAYSKLILLTVLLPLISCPGTPVADPGVWGGERLRQLV
jgi:hypothetical protein